MTLRAIYGPFARCRAERPEQHEEGVARPGIGRDADSLRNLGQLPSAGQTAPQLKTELHQETDALAEFRSPGRTVKGLPAGRPQGEGQIESHVPYTHPAYPARQLET